MTPAAPRIDPRLVAAAERLDETTTPIAETHRRVARVARALRLVQPSYEQIRKIVHDARRSGRRPTMGDILLDVTFRVRPPTAIIDHLVETLPDDGG